MTSPRKSPSPTPEERVLFRRLTDGQVSAEEFEQIDARIIADPAFRDRYLRHMRLEATLHETLNEMIELPLPAVSSQRERSRWPWFSLTAAGVLAIAAALFLQRPNPQVAPVAAGFIESQLAGLPEVAVVTRVEDLPNGNLPSPIRLGQRLKPGVLNLPGGQLELEFVSGARVLVQGPAELHVLSGDRATLLSGQAAARVPDSAKGFTLNAPDAAIVDLGTEFAVNVDAAGRSEVHVTDGEVEVSLLGSDGNTLSSSRLLQSGTLRVSRNDLLEVIDKPSQPFPRVASRQIQPLNVTREYVQAVVKSDPLLYWRFDNHADGVVPNEVSSEFSGILQGSSPENAGIVLEEGHARFSKSLTPRWIEPEQEVLPLNQEGVSIELWMNAESLHHATLVGVIPDGDLEGNHHLTVVELAHRTPLIHRPGMFRFLHRHPPRRLGGINLFSEHGCTPGQWHHLVTVRMKDELRLYVDGQLERTIAAAGQSDDQLYQLMVGQLRKLGSDRQFVGALDEFAVYLRPLTEDEIRQHYSLMVKPSATGRAPRDDAETSRGS